ncbi:Hsp33 family molecular chaperone HslO [Dongia soli]|uniref:Hsp33 family molecular chaperone HslO n=1 Tax=Dongia soli TaxID=600628 RepID=A0ABU5E7F3_9PROT|nr:Hsp33 family molecular chaperone HslO [Dongia soli]MDY0882226.1 Hsp33 family molecular chaperone HslO [Dongia soli]
MRTGLTTQNDADVIQPFQIEGLEVRGRLVRLSEVADEILSRHAYPEPVARLLAEMMALTAVLAAALKYDGIFTLQAKGDGPVRLMVVDLTSKGAMRGYAQFDAEAVAGLSPEQPLLPHLLGAGYLAFTVDQGDYTDRYQGIVELTGSSLADSVHHYFRQSEQLQAGFKLAAGKVDGKWRAGALMLQRLPVEGAGEIAADLAEDAWRRVVAMMASCTDTELIDLDLLVDRLLYSLFHEDGVRVFERQGVEAKCRCSRDRVDNVLRAMPADDLADMWVDGAITVTCEFCNTTYRFQPEDLAPKEATSTKDETRKD